MERFSLDVLTCRACRKVVDEPIEACPACEGRRFDVHISVEVPERGFAGTGPDGEGGHDVCGSPSYHTADRLALTDLGGEELLAFVEAPLEEQKKAFAAWSRQHPSDGLKDLGR